MTKWTSQDVERLKTRWQLIYGGGEQESLERLFSLLEQHCGRIELRERTLWNERDVVMITYGDQVRSDGERALETLNRFLVDHQLQQAINTLHLLPFFPYSSDDGFSVIDYRQVDPALGNWADVARLRSNFSLMFDLVLNHVSSQSDWFQGYLQGRSPCTDYFIEVPPETDVSTVVRPRSLPLLTPVDTSRGRRYVWTTFSPDQIDLNFANPAILLEMIDVLLFYVEQGARIIRLDAIAYLWKTLGTSCIHLPQTHQVVKLFRDVLRLCAPHVLLLTETNVPHRENVSYFGDGDEAHMVYQFSLPPLLLDAFLNEDAGPLEAWLSDLEPAGEGTTFFNFTASHDGVGVRPLEGLVPPPRIDRLVDKIRARGGLVSTRRTEEGRDAPYELNISYVDALGEPGGMEPELHARRFLATQAVMLALRGMPAVYFHSLVGTPNDLASVEATGQPRRINRRKYQRAELDSLLSDPKSLQARIFRDYRRMLAKRKAQPAFHPDGPQRLIPTGSPCMIAFLRTSVDRQQRVLVAVNFSGRTQPLPVKRLVGSHAQRALMGDRVPRRQTDWELAPYECVWLELEN